MTGLRALVYAEHGRERMLTRHATIFFVVTAVALLVRLAYLRTATAEEVSSYTGGDAGMYIASARGLLAGQGFQLGGQPTAYHPPGYPVLLAAVYAVFGTSVAAVGVVHALLGAVTAGVVGAIAARLATPLAGWTAGLITAIYPHLVLWTGYIVSEVPTILLAMTGLWLLVEGQSRGKWPWFAWAGLVLASGALTRSVVLAYIPVAAAATWWLATGRERLLRAGALLLAAAVLIAPWISRNALVIGAPTFSTQTMVVLWWGNNPDLPKYHRGGYAYDPPLPQPLPGTATEADRAAIYGHAVRAYLSSQPWSVVAHMPPRLWNMWRPVFAGASPLNWLLIGGSYLILLALSVAGLVATLGRGAPAGVRYVQLYIVTLALFHALVIAEIRFRMPIEPALAIFAGIAVDRAVAVREVRGWGTASSGSRRS